MKFQSTEKFVHGHNLILGDLPEQISLKDLCEKVKFEKDRIENLGLFGGSSNDFNKFYPDIKVEDLKPRKEDYAYPVYRALSETRVMPYFPVNFEKNHILRQSLKKLRGQTVYANHESQVGNELGSVYDTEWQELQTQDGIIIPAGINSVLQLDGKSNPKIVRGVMGEPPSIHSTSVTVQFEWEQSHPKLTVNEFYAQVGKLDANGDLVERLATNIIAYHEISLVSHGADPYAQQIKDGIIINPGFADTQKFSKEEGHKRWHFMDFKNLGTESLSNQEEAIPKPSNNNENQNKPMKEQLKKLLVSLGVSSDTIDSDSFTADEAINAINKLKDKDTQITSLSNEITALKKEKEDLTAEKTQLQTTSDEAIAELRNEAIRVYQLSVDKTDQGMLDLIASSDIKAVKAFTETFGKQAEDRFQATCQKCGSSEVTRMSSKKDIQDPEKDKFVVKSDAEIAAEYRAEFSKPQTDHIHGKFVKK